MKLTLEEKQIPLAREIIVWLRDKDDSSYKPECEALPGWDVWSERDDSGRHIDWADALEAAITEAEGKDADPRQPGPVSDADERAFWREVFTSVHDDDKRSVATAADQADEALKRYRKAFCTGMPSDQKGSE